jgi:predicted dehydrogenase
VAQVVRVGVIGTGFGAAVVAPAFAAQDGCTVVDVVTPRDEDAVAALCTRADVDLISVHSPPFLHVQHVRQAIENGHAVLCDKPFGMNAAESAGMVQLAADAGVVNLLNFERRYDPARERLRALVLGGAIGAPNHFQYSRFIAVPSPRAYGWLSNRALGGGWLAGQGSHLIDACRWLFGEVSDAAAVMRTPVAERRDSGGVLQLCDAEDGFTAVLRTESGVTAVIDCAIESSVATPEHTAVFGATGAVAIGDAGVVQRMADGTVESYPIDWQGKVPLTLAMERFASVACGAVRAGAAPPGAPTFADGLACARVMDRMGR